MRLLTFLILPLLVTACTTVKQEKISEQFDPVYPVDMADVALALPSGSIYGGGKNGLFVSDRRAADVGDILTVQLSERFQASKAQGMSTGKDNSYSINLPDDIFGSGSTSGLSGGTSQSHTGNGTATQSNSLSGRMSVSVVRVMPGGMLEILGQKKLTLNEGDEYVRLHGFVRPADISPENVIQSDRIASAEITYIGAGQVADSARQGWLATLFTNLSPY